MSKKMKDIPEKVLKDFAAPSRQYMDSLKVELKAFNDSYYNAKRTRTRKANYFQKTFDQHPDWFTIRDLLRTSFIAQNTCMSIPEDAIKNGIDATDTAIATTERNKVLISIMKKWDELGFFNKLVECGTLANGQGGCVIVIGATDGGLLSEPLDVKKVTSLECLSVIPYPWVRGDTPYNTDPLSPNYGKPETYSLLDAAGQGESISSTEKKGQIKIHNSRMLIIHGFVLDRIHRAERLGFGDSFLYKMMESLKTFGITISGVEDIFVNYTQKIFKIAGLLEKMMTTQGQNDLRTRMTLLYELMGNDGAIVIGDDEEIKTLTQEVSGLKAFIDFAMDLVAGSASPLMKTKIFGQQLGTLAGAEETTVQYIAGVEKYQAMWYKPAIDLMFDICYQIETGNAKPDTLQWSFNPYHNPTTGEKIDIQGKAVNSVCMLHDRFLLTDEEARKVLSSESKNYVINVDPKAKLPERPETPPPVKTTEPVIK